MNSPTEDDPTDGLLAQMGKLQQHLLEAQQRATSTEVEGQAGSGAVSIRATGDFAFTKIQINPALAPDVDVTLIEDLVLAALHDAVDKLKLARGQSFGAAMQGVLGNAFNESERELPS